MDCNLSPMSDMPLRPNVSAMVQSACQILPKRTFYNGNFLGCNGGELAFGHAVSPEDQSLWLYFVHFEEIDEALS